MKIKKNYYKYRQIKKRSNKRKLLQIFVKTFEAKNYFVLGLKIIIFIFIFIIPFYYSNGNNPRIILQKIYDFENNLKNYTDEEIKEFRKINSENKLINNDMKFTKSKNPEISVIVTFHNQAHCIHKCIRSIQNQSFKNIEIILVDDCSTDNSTEIIEEYQKYDERIIYIKHDSNEGSIKTRTDGVKIAKGKFITIVDGDDAFIHREVLYNSLSIAKLGNLDVVEFKFSYYRKGEFKTIVNSYDIINITEVIYQPELRTKFFVISDNDSIRAVQNRNIHSKLIRNEIFQKAIINIGPKYTDDYIIAYEDTIMAVALLQVARSYYLMKEVGYYYSRDEFKGRFPSVKDRTCKPNNKIKDMGQVKLLQFLMEKTANNEQERQMLYHEIFSINHYLGFLYVIFHNYEMLYEVLDPMIECSFLSLSQKERLRKLKNDLMKKQNKKKI